MSKVLIIGCGGVAGVAIHKCCQNSEVFSEICIASRTKSKCDALKAELEDKTKTVITTEQVDADDVNQVIALIKKVQPDLVMNIALPYQDLTIMDACLACGVNYLDTANYEPEDIDDPAWRAVYEKRCKEEGFSAYFDYSWQWAYKEKFERPASPPCWAPALTRASPRPTAPTLKSTSSTRSAPSTFWTATAATTATPSPPTSTPRSTSARCPPPAPTGRTATGWRSPP